MMVRRIQYYCRERPWDRIEFPLEKVQEALEYLGLHRVRRPKNSTDVVYSTDIHNGVLSVTLSGTSDTHSHVRVRRGYSMGGILQKSYEFVYNKTARKFFDRLVNYLESMRREEIERTETI